MTGKLLMQAKCEDGENIEISTEWDTDANKVVGAFVALGIKIGVELCGENAQAFYKEIGTVFKRLQDKEVAQEALKMVEKE